MVNKRLEKVNSVAIIEDTGGFSGIIVAAHEVGHLWVINFNVKLYNEKKIFKLCKFCNFISADLALCMTDHHLQAISVDRVQKSADGKTDTLCQIYDTLNEALDGQRAVFKVSITSWSNY